MTVSRSRALRHTATVIALNICACLSSIAAKARCPTKAKATPSRSSRRKTETDPLDELRTFLLNTHNAVFASRYKDVVPAIRRECLNALRLQVEQAPSIFMDSSYIRYFGWMMHDPDSTVRHTALKNLIKIYTTPALASQMNLFTERFKKRVIEMARRERDVKLRMHASRILCELHLQGLLLDDSFSLTDLASMVLHFPSASSASGPAAVSSSTTAKSVDSVQAHSQTPPSEQALAESSVNDSSVAPPPIPSVCPVLAKTIQRELGDCDWPTFAIFLRTSLAAVYGPGSVLNASNAIKFFIANMWTKICESHVQLVQILLGTEEAVARTLRKRKRGADPEIPHEEVDLLYCRILVALAEIKPDVVPAYCMPYMHALLQKFSSQYEHLACLVRVAELAGSLWMSMSSLTDSLVSVLEFASEAFFKCPAASANASEAYINSAVQLFATLLRIPQSQPVVVPRYEAFAARLRSSLSQNNHRQHMRAAIRKLKVPNLDLSLLGSTDADFEIHFLSMLWERKNDGVFFDKILASLQADSSRVFLTNLLMEYIIVFGETEVSRAEDSIEAALKMALSFLSEKENRESTIDTDATNSVESSSLSSSKLHMLQLVMQVVKLLKAHILSLRFASILISFYQRLKNSHDKQNQNDEIDEEQVACSNADSAENASVAFSQKVNKIIEIGVVQVLCDDEYPAKDVADCLIRAMGDLASEEGSFDKVSSLISRVYRKRSADAASLLNRLHGLLINGSFSVDILGDLDSTLAFRLEGNVSCQLEYVQVMREVMRNVPKQNCAALFEATEKIETPETLPLFSCSLSFRPYLARRAGLVYKPDLGAQAAGSALKGKNTKDGKNLKSPRGSTRGGRSKGGSKSTRGRRPGTTKSNARETPSPDSSDTDTDLEEECSDESDYEATEGNEEPQENREDDSMSIDSYRNEDHEEDEQKQEPRKPQAKKTKKGNLDLEIPAARKKFKSSASKSSPSRKCSSEEEKQKEQGEEEEEEEEEENVNSSIDASESESDDSASDSDDFAPDPVIKRQKQIII